MKKIFLISLVMTSLLASCVYYNTFFNAEKYFAEAQEIELKDNGKPQSTAIQKYNKAIKKCGIVLTDYKDSKYADDALFMLARCLYYIGRNYTQSIEKFEDLIKFYPNSDYVPEAKIYIARANYSFRRKEIAYDLLVDFLQQDKYKDFHPEALQQLADYHLQDENYVEVDFYLNQIIEKFPKSEQYNNAFFLKGKARHEAGNYEDSNEVFLALLKSSLPRNLKFDARYYIALNYILLQEYEKALKYADKLLKDEYRESAISKIQLVKARCLAKTGNSEDAIPLFESVMMDNKRSLLAAEAAYHLAEHYFEDLQNYEEAIKYYNKVESENSKSEFVEAAVSRSAVASQIIQYNNPDSELDAEELVLQQFKLAEFYIEALAKPDSALLVYDKIIDQKNDFSLKRDSLKYNVEIMQSKLDSLNTREDILNIAVVMRYGSQDIADSLRNAYFNSVVDSIAVDAVFDSLANNKVQLDSLILNELLAMDSLTFKDHKNELRIEKTNLQSEFNSQKQKYDRLDKAITKYNDDFIPFAKFIKLWLYKTVYQDSVMTSMMAEDLLKNYPENKYTFASKLFLEDKPVEIIEPVKIEHLSQYQKAIDQLGKDNEKAIALLDSIASDPKHTYFLKANYSLGHINFFMLQDSITARPYFDNVLATEDNSEYKTAVSELYNGEKYKLISRLPYLEQLEAKEKQKEEAELNQGDGKEDLKQKEETTRKEETKDDHKQKQELEKQESKEQKKSADDLKPTYQEEITPIPLPQDEPEATKEEIEKTETPQKAETTPEETPEEQPDKQENTEISEEEEHTDNEETENTLETEEEQSDSDKSTEEEKTATELNTEEQADSTKVKNENDKNKNNDNKKKQNSEKEKSTDPKQEADNEDEN